MFEKLRAFFRKLKNILLLKKDEDILAILNEQ